MNLFSLTTLRLGFVCSNFLVSLLALLFFLFSLPLPGIQLMMGLKTLSFLKPRYLLRVTLKSSTGS
jgi:hypothetical protein